MTVCSSVKKRGILLPMNSKSFVKRNDDCHLKRDREQEHSLYDFMKG
jgi:hypothetical protein